MASTILKPKDLDLQCQQVTGPNGATRRFRFTWRMPDLDRWPKESIPRSKKFNQRRETRRFETDAAVRVYFEHLERFLSHKAQAIVDAAENDLQTVGK